MPDAPAVPPPDGLPVEMRFRVGRKVGRTIYRQVGPEPSDSDELVGVMDTRELAALAVVRMNRKRDSLARRLSVRYEELERSRAEVESLTDQLGDMRAMVSAAEADRYQGYRAGREDAAREALDHDAKLNGVRSRALVEYANQHHVVDERGWCSCDMYAPGDDDQCPERVRLFAASLALVRDKPINLGRSANRSV